MVVYSRNYLFNKSDVTAKENATIPLYKNNKCVLITWMRITQVHINKKLAVTNTC